MKRILLSVMALGVYYVGMAQYGKVKIEATDKIVQGESWVAPQPLEGTFIGFRNPPSMDQTWQPVLYQVSKNESEDNELLERIKEEKNRLKESGASQPPTGNKTTVTVSPPVLGVNFAGVSNGGAYTPLDNTLAISDKDTIVAFVNSTIAYYTSTGTNTYSKDIYTMIGDVSITNALCDPKVIYDNVARRFIFYVQVCDQVAAHSQVILGFSKTNNPMNGWYIYKFTGNPLSNGDWWDYPKMAVSNDEVFVTGNLFKASTGLFDKSAVYQIQKTPCMAGATLTSANSQYFTTPEFSLLPVGYGQKGSYGPGIYLVSTGGAVSSSTTMKLMDITNNKASGTATLMTYDVSCAPYSVSGDALQQGTTTKLNTGDCRALDGFYLRGVIHFVFNIDISGYCGISLNRVTVSSLGFTSSLYHNSGVSDYCYAAIASPSNDSNDKSVVVAYNESGSGMFPRTCAARTDQSGNWSAATVVKAGAGYAKYSGTTTSERWGDYTGMAKKYGDPTGSVWMAGMYGNTTHTWSQWIAKLNPYKVGVNTVTEEEKTTKVFPNPIVDNYHVQFNLDERQEVTINITDMDGRTVVELYKGMTEAGENMFAFNKSSMTPGIYSLNIIGAKTNIKNEKIVIADK